jgi:hypothetical protein
MVRLSCISTWAAGLLVWAEEDLPFVAVTDCEDGEPAVDAVVSVAFHQRFRCGWPIEK